jgi:hypothetical protein
MAENEGKNGRFQQKIFPEFVPTSFRLTDHRSRPGVKLSFFYNVSLLNRPSFLTNALPYFKASRFALAWPGSYLNQWAVGHSSVALVDLRV